MKRAAVIASALAGLLACGGHGSSSADGGELAELCAAVKLDPPTDLACTGLYTDPALTQLSSAAVPYAPATPLWADSADKNRWIELAAGTTIDNSNPSEWMFPVGTKIWKEFARDGHRMETRYLHKLGANNWTYAAYAWSEDEASAKLTPGEDLGLADGGTYHIPSPSECEMCHRGRTDRLLGFEEVSLGLPGASGLTLTELVAKGLLSAPVARTALSIGDDGTKNAAAALAWLHINCGATCHNANENSAAYGVGMRLRLDPTLLDGRSSAMFDALATTVGVSAITPGFSGQVRISPGAPDDSLLVHLISSRGDQQMPPIASDLVDDVDVAKVRAWIAAMPSPKKPDGGTFDGGALSADGVTSDGGSEMDGGADDGGRSDAGTHDGGLSDAGGDAG